MFNFDVNGLVEQIKPAIAKVAESLGTSGEKLLEVGIRGMIAQGVFYAIGCLICIGVMILAAALFRNGWKRSKDPNTRYGDGEGFMAFGIIAGIIGLVAFMFLAYGACIHLIAPDYALLMEVKSFIQGRS